MVRPSISRNTTLPLSTSILQQVAKHARRLLGDGRADAIAAAHPDDDLIQRRVVNKILLAFETLGPLQLGAQQGLKMVERILNVLFVHFEPFLSVKRI